MADDDERRAWPDPAAPTSAAPDQGDGAPIADAPPTAHWTPEPLASEPAAAPSVPPGQAPVTEPPTPAATAPVEPTLAAVADDEEGSDPAAASAESAADGPVLAAVPPVVGESATPEAPQGDFAGALAELRNEVAQRLDELQKAISQAAALQERQATMVQQLHAENQVLRQGELTQALKPFIMDVARLHDDVERVISHGGEALSKAAPIPEFILDVLDRHGVSQIRPERGDSFDSKLHQGLKVAPTSDQGLDGKVQSVIRPGFIRDGAHLVRAAQVAVYRYSEDVAVPWAAPAEAEQQAAVPATPTADPQGADPGSVPPTTTKEQAGSNDVG